MSWPLRVTRVLGGGGADHKDGRREGDAIVRGINDGVASGLAAGHGHGLIGLLLQLARSGFRGACLEWLEVCDGRVGVRCGWV